MKISSEPYGKLPGGEPVTLYRLENNSGMCVEIINYGAVITSVRVPGKNGESADVVLGYASMDTYLRNPGFLGAAVGRNSNRITGAMFSIGETVYQVDKNDGNNNLHGGNNCLSLRLFRGEVHCTQDTPSLVLTHTIEDMSDGFPGNLDVTIRYTLTSDNELMIEYHGSSDKDTLINLTNHSYFNLAGHNSGTIKDQVLQLDAPFFCPNTKEGIPSGELYSVAGTPFDFQEGKRLGQDIDSSYEQTALFGGYDHNMVPAGRGYRRIGSLYHPESGRLMEVFTDLPGVQLYTSNMLSATEGCKEGAAYGKHQAVCLETQTFPDAIHMPWLVSPLYAAGEEYSSTTTYKFSVK